MDYLYHYTSIESLALILKRRTIRFTSLDNVDDMDEGLANDVDGYGQFVFVSCWTKNAKESIPQWNMYGKDMGGVRIALPKYPFLHYSFLGNPKRIESYPFQDSLILKDGYIDDASEFPWGERYLIDVEYLHSSIIQTPVIVEKIDEHNKITHLGRLGKFKDDCWAFQEEVRYRIILHPTGGVKPDGNGKYRTSIEMKQKFIDVPIRDDAFEGMQILLGPKHTESNLVILNALLDTYNPKVQRDVVSSLRIRNKI
ncbi:hypothetical protein CPT03_19090 [Pedobacter ginsengisoli]|uniref:DUF2971 domain-containing protein n=1 Tax=Pedobacter ginsengisoli TaxID=363852 RepID=A0A2D1U9W8_9SPHI|nr:DUF2971 domain-containing protein [Pedobacter ginsengisoli]ATP58417.1 hypothetical protein CPT03_19090 [Pedobacter ginsengisoli]